MRRRLPQGAGLVEGDDVPGSDVERGVPDDDGRGLCGNRRCLFARDRQPLHAKSGLCVVCCARACFPGECDDCQWRGLDGEEYADEDDDD